MEKARVVGKDHFLTVWGGGGVLVGFKGGMVTQVTCLVFSVTMVT